MDAKQQRTRDERLQLLNRLAELLVEEQRAQGTFQKVPHHSALEQAARTCGQELSRASQQRLAAERGLSVRVPGWRGVRVAGVGSGLSSWLLGGDLAGVGLSRRYTGPVVGVAFKST
jgi:hypothetical protein